MLTKQVPATALVVGPPPTVQTGPIYYCPACGQPATGLVPWPVDLSNPCLLDAWAAHIGYLRRGCGCRTGGRVARLGDCITPLEFAYDHTLPYAQRVAANLRALQAALAQIAAFMAHGGPHGHPA
jgi:hypothetical protein